MTGLASSIPGAVDGLLADLRTMAAANQTLYTDLTVFDGELVTFEPVNWIVVGGVKDATQRSADFGNRRRDEQYTIECMLQVFNGDDITIESKPARDLAFGLLELVVEQINTDYTLGGAIRFCQLVSADVTVAKGDQGGTVAQIDFGIMCQATLQL